MDNKNQQNASQNDLFTSKSELADPKDSKELRSTQSINTNAPLPSRARPLDFSEFKGQSHLSREYRFIKEKNLPSMILWGPPGTGKTTLAHVLANNIGRELYTFNAVLGGVNDLKKLIKSSIEMKAHFNKEAIIFVDEIHRFNKSQQDALLPFVESGEILLIGATTENPRVSVNKALLSRLQVVELKKLESNSLLEILTQAAQKFEIEVKSEILEFIAESSNGDARFALNILDLIEKQSETLDLETVTKLVNKNNRDYDKNQDRHYDVISAFIKSMRGTDPDAALLYLAIMLDGGEDPVFIARRLIIFASEDIGNADPTALTLAVSGLQAVQNIGMPEARINLGQVTTYLASTVKSNAAYKAIDAALDYVRSQETIDVPGHLQNQNVEIKNYKYPHSYPEHYVKQKYTVKDIPNFYQPTDLGTEKKIKDRLKKL